MKFSAIILIVFREINEFVAPIPNPPAPLPLAAGLNGLILVNNPAHPFMTPGPDDLRGPCPASKTLANHGYLPRNGVGRPDQIVTAVMEGKFAFSALR
ncbi:hypothetical protein M422DRAFT_268458 [Sphaerobolus stellatus SS14]|uniref:Heme haloperoxidase family profile domain-containing protein n=1 Tax=Sphaerobolus stellatus (strain SS14) TaxID=990650 RepID=A0A0C9UMQ0_SPHS4|nr:hypothetical protein M422DRAFT_268458 [Sphaerobolus stellatus SS14]